MTKRGSSDEAERFVITADARAAVAGREGEILNALGIDWQKGRPHIDCPYPSHGGANDWRWDERKVHAYCTCATGDSVFDVIMKCEALDFDEAKIRAVELAGSSDLIRTRRGRAGDPDNQYQKSDAAGLLEVKPEFRDDYLVAAYLASRLGIAPSEVLLPSTGVRGITKMPYWEAGRGKGAKPKNIGSFPCVVFLQVDKDRNKHAHRIYVQPGGKGKADLDGRDPKKSAKVIGDDKVHGRAVLWGRPDQASHIVLCEGIETAAAVAHALRPEIERNEIVVASAISAGGIEAFSPWPATKKVTIAADRDDAEKRGKPGSQRGEHAARKFALRNLQSIKSAIALPGAPGESLDWLNVLEASGAEAVRDGVLSAPAFVPTREELEHQRRSIDREAELAKVSRTYPLPVISSKPLVYAFDSSDKVKVHKTVTIKDPVTKSESEALIPVATPFGITARLRHADQDDVYSLRIVVQDMNGRPRQIDVRRDSLPRMAASDIRSLLLGAGLRVEDDGEAIAVACLKAADPDAEILVMQRPAWHFLPDYQDPFFVAPDGTTLGAPADVQVELDATVRMAPAIARSGTLVGWKAAAAAALREAECPHWTIGILAGLAGPLVALTGLDTCGVNLSGMSSSGKSTAQKLAASAWSTPDLRKPGLSQSARTTSNGIEALAQRSNGTVLSLDELAHISGKEVGKAIYTIASGAGKTRMKADASVRAPYTWATFAVMSAESSLEEKVTSDGGEWMAGMAVRIVDVDVTGINRSVSQETMQAINSIDQHFGHAGPAFVEALISRGLHRCHGELRNEMNEKALLLAGGAKADAAKIRAALPFAILATAGQLAQNLGVLPDDLDINRVISWAWGRFQNSSDAMALAPEEQAVANIRLWIAERWGSSIHYVDSAATNRDSVAWFDDDAVYIPRARLREAAGSVLKEAEIASALVAKEALVKREDAKRAYIRYVPKVGKLDAYALARARFGRTSATYDPDNFRVYQGGRGDEG